MKELRFKIMHFLHIKLMHFMRVTSRDERRIPSQENQIRLVVMFKVLFKTVHTYVTPQDFAPSSSKNS